jgi:hypothetical protein
LLQLPSPIDEKLKLIVCNASFKYQCWRMGEAQFAAQLPETISQDLGTVCEIGMEIEDENGTGARAEPSSSASTHRPR